MKRNLTRKSRKISLGAQNWTVDVFFIATSCVAYKIETITFERSRMVGKLLKEGSRLLVTLDVNKHSFAQVNFGTGKDVSDEDIGDGLKPLNIQWFNTSYIDIPMAKIK